MLIPPQVQARGIAWTAWHFVGMVVVPCTPGHQPRQWALTATLLRGCRASTLVGLLFFFPLSPPAPSPLIKPWAAPHWPRLLTLSLSSILRTSRAGWLAQNIFFSKLAWRDILLLILCCERNVPCTNAPKCYGGWRSDAELTCTVQPAIVYVNPCRGRLNWCEYFCPCWVAFLALQLVFTV